MTVNAAPKSCLIVGAGPAGLASAIDWAKQGWRVTVLERRPRIEQKICGECLSPPSRGLLARLGVLEKIPSGQRREIDAIRITGPRGSRCNLDFGTERAFTIPRGVLDQALLERARELGVTVEFGAAVVALARRPEGGFRLEERSGRTHDGDFLIGADGRHSWVARELGLARAARHRLRHAAIMGHFSIPGPGSNRVEMMATPWGYVGLNPLPPALFGAAPGGARDYLNVIAVLKPEELKRRLGGEGPAGLHRLLVELVQGSSAPPWLAGAMRFAEPVSDAVWTASPLAWRPARVTGADCALVGDSAGFIDPFTGEGLYHSFVSARRLADLAAECGAGARVPANALARYARWHREAFGPEEKFCLRLQQLLPHAAVADFAIRRLAAKPALARVLAEAVADRLPTRVVLSPWFWLKVLWPSASLETETEVRA